MIIYTSEDIATKMNQEVELIKKSINKLIDLVQISNIKTQQRDNKIRQQNPYIVKSVIKNMAKGLNMDDAITLAAEEFKTTSERIETLMWEQKRYHSAIRLYARRYLCEKLKEYGLKTKDIARIAGVSTNHVYKMLKANPDFWFLERKPVSVDYPQYF